MMYLVFDVMQCEWHGNGTGLRFIMILRAGVWRVAVT